MRFDDSAVLQYKISFIKSTYTSAEQVDMLLVYGFCKGNGHVSVRIYRQRFPNRQVASHQTLQILRDAYVKRLVLGEDMWIVSQGLQRFRNTF